MQDGKQFKAVYVGENDTLPISDTAAYYLSLSDELSDARERMRVLEQLCKASLHLLKGADIIYDPRGDTGPTHWLSTRDQLVEMLEVVVDGR